MTCWDGNEGGNLGNYQEAAKVFERYLAARPDDYVAKANYANTLGLGLLREYEKVIEVLQSLPTEVEQELVVINALASAFLGLNKPELALEVLEKGSSNKRKMTDEHMKLFRYLLGVTYKELGEVKKAIQQLNKVYIEDAEYADVKELLEELSGGKTTGGS
ncbi:MAG: tetratricopeptide repeat protein [Firmicutes bacterium]|nr:tetratricopeptide repeat protein [Bacillota bacterium]